MSGPVPDVDVVAERVRVLRARIADLTDRQVRIVAVTKGFGADAVRAAVAAGVSDIGENYAQELLGKHAALGDLATRVRWHFIGRLQRNKVRSLAPVVSIWQSIDREPLAEEVARRAPGATVLVQLNLSGEEHKGGCALDEAPRLVSRCLELGLDVRGLMGVGPAGPPERARPGFRRLVAMADELGLPERSIGMSADLDLAVEEGSTMVRVGRALFGPRPLPGAGATPLA
ncbi:MAG: YggS family pyridoxal phosphate-dependent enzyme [Acidimicrobiales bacterium]